MKITVVKFLVICALALPFTGCKDRAAEKRIAELESRLAELEGKKTSGSSASGQAPVIQPVTEEKPEGPIAAIQFDKTEHDFGSIKEGDVVEYTYAFKNTGEAPLIIQNAQGSCGCTVPDWSRDPIPAGGTGYVKAKFDSNGKPNLQNKTVTVTANTYPKQTVLRFKAMVSPKAGAPSEGPVKK